tara:strand:- start:3495 stop:3839 length:345 start_codon:yes stop_codon:yes gene_type:complete
VQSNEIINEMKTVLLEKRNHLIERLEKIQSSKIRTEPLSADSGEQSIELENTEVVDALDEMEHKDLKLVNHALGRIENGAYGMCASCGEDISLSRLKALPFTPLCVHCAEEAAS